MSSPNIANRGENISLNLPAVGAPAGTAPGATLDQFSKRQRNNWFRRFAASEKASGGNWTGTSFGKTSRLNSNVTHRLSSASSPKRRRVAMTLHPYTGNALG